MSSINGKLGLRPAGKRAMMKLPKDRALRNQVTAAKCPSCDGFGALVSKVKPGYVVCSWCNHEWKLTP